MQETLIRTGVALCYALSSIAAFNSWRKEITSNARHICVTVVPVILVLTSSSSLADGAPSYAALLQQSLSNAPMLLEQEANVRAASADVRQARALPNPSINAMYENIGAPQVAGASQRQDTYSITQPFEIGGKRAARIEVKELGLTAAEARARLTQITFSVELSVAYAMAEAMQERKSLATEELARASDDLRAARALVAAGREAELRLEQALASAAAAQANEQAATADATEALERLSALVGAQDPFTRIDHPFLDKAATYRPVIDSNRDDMPAVESATAERDVFAAQVRVDEKK